MNKLVILFLLISNITYGATGNVVQLKKDQPAPYDGFLIDKDKVDKIHDDETDLDKYKNLYELEKTSNLYFSERLDNYKEVNDYLSKQLIEQKDNSFYSKIGMFVLGTVITGALAYGIYRTK